MEINKLNWLFFDECILAASKQVKLLNNLILQLSLRITWKNSKISLKYELPMCLQNRKLLKLYRSSETNGRSIAYCSLHFLST